MKTLVLPPNLGARDMVKVASHRVWPSIVDPEVLQAVENRRDILARARQRLLPIEEGSRQELETEYQQALKETAKLRRQQEIVEHFGPGFQIFDTGPLKWRNNQGLPILGVFSLKHPMFGFECVLTNGRIPFEFGSLRPAKITRMFPSLPAIVSSCYTDVQQKVIEEAERRVPKSESGRRPILESEVRVKLSTQFGGMIPDHVKSRLIPILKSHLFLSVFIVAEVEEWQFDAVVTSRTGDPLVIGHDGHQLWLLDKFDTTSVEQLAADEFAVRVENYPLAKNN